MTTWIKVFNSMPSHPKFVLAGGHAAWLFVCGCCYANEHLTDGFIARHALVIAAPGVRRPEALAARLVTAGLWHPVEGGWQIHDYGEHQRSSAKIREGRARDAERKASERSSNGSPRGQTLDSAQSPTGVRPESTRLEVEVEKSREETEGKAARKRVTRRVDQSKPPEDFPAELVAAIDAVLPILHRAWDVKGGIEPMVRGVALGIARNPRADHLGVARKLEHWVTSGNGQRAQCKDLCARFGDWVENEGAALTVIPGGHSRGANVIAERDRWKQGYGQEASS